MKAEPAIEGRRVIGLVRDDLPVHHIRCPRCDCLLDMRKLDGLIRHDQRCEAEVWLGSEADNVLDPRSR